MGFSVSGSFVILFLAVLVVFSTVYPVTTETADRIDEADDQMADLELQRENTAINITRASFNTSGNDHAHLTIRNTGTTALHVNETTILIDNEYQTQSQLVSTDVEGNTATDIWLPDERLNVTTDPTGSSPTAVVVVSEYDVEDREGF